MLKKDEVFLIDVREPAEFAAQRIHGAFLFPLSTFDPKAIPTEGTRKIVFQCGSGKRSRAALDAFLKATGKDAAHMAGGIGIWKACNLPTVTINPAPGQVMDNGRF